MDLQSQAAIKRMVDEQDADSVVVVLGAPDPEAAGLAAETVVIGDPTYAGPLTETQLGLAVYHVLEPKVRAAVPMDVWEEHIGVMADVLEADALGSAVSRYRNMSTDGGD